MPRTLVAGVDVGGTKMLGVVIDPDRPREVLAERRLSTPRGPDALVAGVAELVALLDADVSAALGHGAASLGVGIPGLIGTDGRFRMGPNLPGVTDFPVAERLTEATGRPVRVDNDATCAALTEFRAGAGAPYGTGVLVTLGTGIGGGIVQDGRILHGARGYAGEPGHMVVDPNGPPCPCGRRGCWERFASGSGLGRLARDAATGGRLGAAVALSGGDPEAVRGEHVVEAARAGDAEAAVVLDEFSWWVGLGIANIIDLLDPAVVVVGGGLSAAADQLLERIVAATHGEVLGHQHRDAVPVVCAEWGVQAGAVGAALL